MTKVRPAALEDLKGIWQLLAEQFDFFAKFPYAEFERLFSHLWVKNPAFYKEHKLGWVMETPDKRIGGFLGIFPLRYKIGESTMTITSGTSWAMAPACRSRSFDFYKELMKWGSEHFLIDTTASPIVAQLHSRTKMGMQELPVEGYERRFLWVIRPQPVLGHYFQKKGGICRFLDNGFLKSVLSFFVRIALALKKNRICFKCEKLEVFEVDRFTGEFDALWEKLKGKFPITLERRAEFLNWRIFDFPSFSGRYHVFACRDKNSLAGYLILKQRAGQDLRYSILDLFADPDKKEVIYNLLNHAYEFVEISGGAMLEFSGFGAGFMRELKTQNPLILGQTHCSYWFKTADDKISQICHNKEWWPSSIDGDLNI